MKKSSEVRGCGDERLLSTRRCLEVCVRRVCGRGLSSSDLSSSDITEFCEKIVVAPNPDMCWSWGRAGLHRGTMNARVGSQAGSSVGRSADSQPAGLGWSKS